MKRIIIFAVSSLVGAGMVRAQEFPAEQIWGLEFEDTVTCLGSVWTENNDACALVGTNGRLHMVRNGEVVWSSRDIGLVFGAGRVEFEDGISLIATTTAAVDSEVINRGVVHRFYGDGFDEYMSGSFTGLHEGMLQFGYDFIAKVILQPGPVLDDSLKTIFLWCQTNYMDIDVFGSYTQVIGGVIHAFSLENMALIEGRSGITPYSPISLNLVDVDGGERNEMILAGNSFYSHYQHSTDITTVAYEGGITIWDSEGEREVAHHMVGSVGNYGPGWPWVPPVGISGVTVTESGDLIAAIQKLYPDSSVQGFGVYSLPEMERTAWHSKPSGYNLLGTVTEIDNEEYLIGITGQSHITVFHLPDFRIVYDDAFLQSPLFRAVLQDFDGDLSDDLLILAGNTLSLFSIDDLDIQSSWVIPHPSSLILSAYPNPFNSRATINYSLPKPGRYAIDVVDISGRLVVRLSDGWKEAGSYREVWDGEKVGNGVYWIRLDSGAQILVQKAALIR